MGLRGSLRSASLFQPPHSVASVSLTGVLRMTSCVFERVFLGCLTVHCSEAPSSWKILFWEQEMGVGRVKHYSAKEPGWAS